MSPPHARAATVCSVDSVAVNLSLGTVNGTAPASATDNVRIRCTFSGFTLLSSPVYVKACIYVGGRSPRQLTNGSTSLGYDLQNQSGLSLTGTTGVMPPGQVVQLTIPTGFISGGASATEIFPITAKMPAQVGLAPGTYSQTVTETAMDYNVNEPGSLLGSTTFPASCVSGSPIAQRFTVTTTATVPGSCSLTSASTLDFGTIPGLMTGNQDQTGSIGLQCTTNTRFNLTLGSGQNASGAVRRMAAANANFVTYEIYTDPARAKAWAGDTVVSSIGTGAAQTIPVYGRIPVQEAVPGTYNDVVTITLTY